MVRSALLLMPFMALAARSVGAASCTEVSVERDATYCITGPICSGTGAAPAGLWCPKKGDVAVKDCLKDLKSYVDGGKCVAPADAQCMKIHTGAWGCVWPDALAKNTSSPAVPGSEKNTATTTSATPCPGIPGWEKPTPAPTTGMPGWQKPTPAPSTPCPGIPGWEKPTPAPTTGMPGLEKPTPAPTTGMPGIGKPTPAPTTGMPGLGKPTPAPSTPCPVIPGWENLKSAPSVTPATSVPSSMVPATSTPVPISTQPSTAPATATPVPTSTQPSTAPATATPVPTTTQPSTAPTTVAPAIAVTASHLSASDESKDTSNSNMVAIGAAVVGAVAAVAAAAFAFKKHQSANKIGSPEIYRGTALTPV